MIDPNIMLAGKPVEVQDPAQQAQEWQSLRNMQTANQLGQVQVQNAQQVQRIQQQQLDDRSAFNDALAKNSKVGADGKYTVDENGVMQHLSKQGYGHIAQAYQSDQVKLKQQAQQLSNEQLQHAVGVHEQVDGKLGTLLFTTDPWEREQAYQKEKKWAQETFGAEAGEMSEMAPSQGELRSMLMRSAAGRQALEVELQEREAGSRERLARSSEEKNNIFLQKLLESERKPIGTQHHHPVYLDPNNPKRYKEQDDITLDDFKDTTAETIAKILAASRVQVAETHGEYSVDAAEVRANNPNSASAGAQHRFDQKEVDAARKDLNSIHRKRDAYGRALATPNGSFFIEPESESGKQSADEMDNETRAKLQEQYQTITNQGYGIIDRFADDKSKGIIRSNELPPRKGAAQPPPPPPPPADASAQDASAKPASAQPTSRMPPESTVVSNPRTGEKRKVVNGQWKVISPARTADPMSRK